MSGQKKQDKKEESGSGLGTNLLLAAGAGALGFLASQLYSSYKEHQASQSSSHGGGGGGGSRAQTDWSDTEGNNTTKRKDNRTRVHDTDVPEAMKCIVCMENPREIILLPCNHVCLCEDCAGEISGLCPICRIKITGKKNVYLP